MRKTIFINYDIHSTTLGMSAFMNNKVFFPKLTFKFIVGAGGGGGYNPLWILKIWKKKWYETEQRQKKGKEKERNSYDTYLLVWFTMFIT